jgi:hypothetical protein
MTRPEAQRPALALAACAALALASAGSVLADAPDLETPVATVGREIVPVAAVRAELQFKVDETRGLFDPTDPAERRAAIDRLIDRRLFYLGALDEIPDVASTADSVRRHEQIRATWLSLKRGLHPVPEALTLEAVDAFREDRAAAWFGRQILVMTTDEADEVLARLETGEEFADLAKEISYDVGSAAAGGRLYHLRVGDWYPQLIELAFGLEPGEVGGPVTSRNGYHILHCDSVLYMPEDPEIFTPYEMRVRILRKAEFDGLQAVVDEHVERFGITVWPRAVDLVVEHLWGVGNPTKPPRKDPRWTPPSDLPMATSAEGDTMSIPEFFAEMDVLGGWDWPALDNPRSVETSAERLMIAYVLRRRMNEGRFDPGPLLRAEIDAVVHRHLGNQYFAQILDPGPIDSVRAEEIFTAHPDAFLVPRQASVAILGVSTAAMADSVEAWLAGGMSVAAAGARARTMDTGAFYNRPTPLYPEGMFPEHDALVFETLEVGEVSERERTATGFQWYHLARREPARRASRLELTTETLTERARAYLLERARIANLERLRELHPVERNEAVIEELVRHADH